MLGDQGTILAFSSQRPKPLQWILVGFTTAALSVSTPELKAVLGGYSAAAPLMGSRKTIFSKKGPPNS